MSRIFPAIVVSNLELEPGIDFPEKCCLSVWNLEPEHTQHQERERERE